MNQHAEWTPAQWFAEAARAYVEGHQACVWCGGCHRVFRSEKGSRLEYYCSACDFCAGHDREADDYYATPGQPAGSAADRRRAAVS
jgi:hypothetical protein